MPAEKLSRRSAIHYSLACVVTAGLSPNSSSAHDGYSEKMQIARGLGALFTSTDSAVAVGTEYLRSMQDAPGLAAIVDDLFPSTRVKRWVVQASDGAIREYLEMARCRDFEEGSTVAVGGWILAETEAKVCAAATFAKSS